MSLKGVAQETLAILEAGVYAAPSGDKRSVGAAQAAAVAGTVLYTPEALERLLQVPGSGGSAPRIEVVEASTQAAACRLVVDEGLDIALLNFASARNAGGGFIRGAKAQEEDVTRCSGLYPCLLTQPDYYRVNRSQRSMLYTDHLIYSPRVPFFRVRSQELLEVPFVASVLTSPAPNAGQYLRRGHSPSLLDAALQHRAGCVLAAAREQGHQTLLLGAWGCGVFRNDPAQVAAAFDHWLMGGHFAGAFERVVFAILDGTPGQHVLRAFQDHFDN